MSEEYTNLASFYAGVCQKLAKPSPLERGDAYLAKKFGTTAWSPDFYKLLSGIILQSVKLNTLFERTDLSNDLKRRAIKHNNNTIRAFSASALTSKWATSGMGMKALSKENTTAIAFCADHVGKISSYKKLKDDEIASLMANIGDLTTWLAEHEKFEADFIRQALIEGLSELEFRLKYVEWLGWSYASESLREVVSAYMALDRGIPPDARDPQLEALFLKMNGFLSRTWDVLGTTRDGFDRIDVAVRIYALAHMVSDVQTISGLLPYIGKS